MTEQTSLDLIQALLRDSSGAIDPPAVEPLRSVIRSGEAFLFSGQAPGMLGPGPVPPACQHPMEHLGCLLCEWGFSVMPEHAAQFHRWLEVNEAELSQVAPQGVRYRGTYAVVAQSDLSLGDYRSIWVFDSVAAAVTMDQACAAGGRFAQLLAELNSFRDRRIGATRSQQMYQPAAHTRRSP